MSFNYIVWILFGTFLVILAEYASGIRSRKKREFFAQPFPPNITRIQVFLRTCIVMVLVLLASACILAGKNCTFEVPKDGIAIVVDVSSLSQEKSLDLEKNVVESFAGYCPGVPLSLYELRGGALFSVCPPTIDSIFFKLQVGSLTSAGVLGGAAISLQQIEQEIVKRYRTVAPWVVVASSTQLPSQNQYLQGLATISIGRGGVECTLYNRSKGVTIRSLDLLAQQIQYHIVETQKSNVLNSDHMLLVSSCVVLALLLFLYWRSQWPPLYLFVSIVLIFSCDLIPLHVANRLYTKPPPQDATNEIDMSAIDECEANNIVLNAIDLAQGGMLSESEKRITTLLNITESPEARARLTYDRSLLLYLRGDNREALNWILKVPKTGAESSFQREISTLHGLILIRLLRTYSSSEEYTSRQKDLLTWLQSGSIVSADLIDEAHLALMTTQLNEEQSILFTIHWLQNAILAGHEMNSEPFFRCLDGITTETNGIVQSYLQKFFDAKTIEQFSIDVSKVSSLIDLNRVYLWYYLAMAHTVFESVDYLFQEGCTLSNRALFFHNFRKIAEANLPMISDLLRKIQKSLEDDQKKAFSCLYDKKPQSFEEEAALWYACKVLWPTVSEEGKARYKALAIALTNEMRSSLPVSTKKMLANSTSCLIHLPQIDSEHFDPLVQVLNKILEAWYQIDRSDLFEFILNQYKTNSEIWESQLTLLLSYSIQKDAGYSSLSKEISKVFATDTIQTFDTVLLTYLWVLGLTPNNSIQLFSLQLHDLYSLLKQLHTQLVQPSDALLKTFCLIYQVMPTIVQSLQKGNDYLLGRKNEIYEKLLYEFIAKTNDIQTRIAQPSTFRLPKVREEIVACAFIVEQMMTLFSETDEPVLSGGGIQESTYIPGTLQGKSAVTLFQELDRSDRELFGEYSL